MPVVKLLFVLLATFSLTFANNNPLEPDPESIGCVRTSTGTDYLGNQNISSAGRPCVRWDSLVGAFRDHIRQLFMTMPEKNAAKAENFCRNPNSDQRGLWCFVSQLGQVQFCSVPKCNTFGSTAAPKQDKADENRFGYAVVSSERPWVKPEVDYSNTYDLTNGGSFQNDEAYPNNANLYGDGIDPYANPSLMEQRSDWNGGLFMDNADPLQINFRPDRSSSNGQSLHTLASVCLATTSCLLAAFFSL